MAVKNKIDNQHDRALQQIDNQMAADLQKQRDAYNRQLQRELEQTLLVRD